jgi:hypothetical protein
MSCNKLYVPFMKKFVLITMFGIGTIRSMAQSTGTISNFAVWPGFEVFMPLHENGRWGLFAEGYVKRVNFLKDPMGLFGRVGATYYLKNGNRISGGLAYQYNDAYDAGMLPYGWPDWRLWQQYMLRVESKKNKEHIWTHRFRLEERWLGRKNNALSKGYDYYKHETTFRYMVRSQWYTSARFGVAVYDEVHLRIASSEPDERLLDQNRIYGGIIYALDKQREWRLETGYMFQSMWNPAEQDPNERIRINHTWRITLTADAPLRRKPKQPNKI